MSPAFARQRQVHRHLITVEVGIGPHTPMAVEWPCLPPALARVWIPNRQGRARGSLGCSAMTSSSTSSLGALAPTMRLALDVLRMVEVHQPLHHEWLNSPAPSAWALQLLADQ